MKSSTIFNILFTTTLLTPFSVLKAQEKMEWRLGDHTIHIEHKGSFGQDDYSYAIAVTYKEKTIFFRKSDGPLRGLRIIPESISKSEDGGWFAYQEIIDGLDDCNVYLIKLTLDRVIEAYSTIGYPEGIETITNQYIPFSMGEQAKKRLERATYLAYPTAKLGKQKQQRQPTTIEKTKDNTQQSERKPTSISW